MDPRAEDLEVKIGSAWSAQGTQVSGANLAKGLSLSL